LPLFDAGRLRNLYRSQAALVDGAVATYNGALLEALRDVADQLSSLQALETQLSRQQATLASAERSYDLALQRYEAGITDRLSVLNVESNLIAQRHISVEQQARWIDGRVLLIRALGGGFQETPEVTTSAQIPVRNAGIERTQERTQISKQVTNTD
jgi:outer membrane protein TolC